MLCDRNESRARDLERKESLYSVAINCLSPNPYYFMSGRTRVIRARAVSECLAEMYNFTHDHKHNINITLVGYNSFL
ncbi:hypothetical protein CsatB_017381 [Cannabis sativa]